MHCRNSPSKQDAPRNNGISPACTPLGGLRCVQTPDYPCDLSLHKNDICQLLFNEPTKQLQDSIDHTSHAPAPIEYWNYCVHTCMYNCYSSKKFTV